jgi:hypothetical protein
MTKKLAKEGAQSFGINMDVECAWIGPPDNDGLTPFGPDAKKDNIYQNLPQVNLHGMDEGLTLKMCTSILNATISEAIALHKINTTSVSDEACYSYFYVCFYVCFNVCFYVCIEVSFDVSFKVSFNVSFHVSFHVSFDVSFNV